MLKNILFITSILMLNTPICAQFTEQISSDRPGFSLSSNTVGKNVYQIQAGGMSTNYSYLSNSFWTLNQETNIRIGIVEKFELNGNITTYNSGSTFGDLITNDKYFLIENIFLGARYHFVKQKGILPNLTLQANLAFKSRGTVPFLTLITNHEIGEKLSLTTNTIYDLNASHQKYILQHTVNLAATLTKKYAVFIEGKTGVWNSGGVLNGGFAYGINSNLQLDFAIGTMLQKHKNDYETIFFNVGVSYRLNRRTD